MRWNETAQAARSLTAQATGGWGRTACASKSLVYPTHTIRFATSRLKAICREASLKR
jgi:hypothetical protein